MSEFFFNDLSIQNQFKDKKAFLNAIEFFGIVRSLVIDANYSFYVHRNILERGACGLKFRQAVLQHCNKNQIQQVMNWVNKSGNFLPDEQTFCSGDRFTHNGIDVSSSAIAECAYRCILRVSTFLTSLCDSDYNKSSLLIDVISGGKTDCIEIINLFNKSDLLVHLQSIKAPITSWAVLMDQITTLPSVNAMPYVIDQLESEPFAANIAEECYRRAKALSDMAQCSSIDCFNELYSKYCTGDSWFSDSSATEKIDFKSKLTFTVHGSKKLCPYHGKIKIRQFRIHVDEVPAFKKIVNIVYIGQKLTKI